jgi:hypothetical protein
LLLLWVAGCFRGAGALDVGHETPNAKLSRRVAVGSNAGLERGGAANDGYEKNPALDASAVLNPE